MDAYSRDALKRYWDLSLHEKKLARMEKIKYFMEIYLSRIDNI